MKRSIFGKSALDKISSIDQLDQMMTVVKPSSVLALISVGIMIAVAIVWGILGTVPDVVTGMGVLVNIDHITSVKYANSGEEAQSSRFCSKTKATRLQLRLLPP